MPWFLWRIGVMWQSGDWLNRVDDIIKMVKLDGLVEKMLRISKDW